MLLSGLYIFNIFFCCIGIGNGNGGVGVGVGVGVGLDNRIERDVFVLGFVTNIVCSL